MRQIYITRHGESVNNVLDIIGGDCGLTENGRNYGFRLGEFFIASEIIPDVWTSELKRTRETAECVGIPYVKWGKLNEIYSGIFDNMKLSEIQYIYPNQYKLRNSDKLNNSYTGGENYKDLFIRVSSILDLINMSSTHPLLIICHKAVCRVIYSYLTNVPLIDCVDKDIGLNQLIIIDGPEVVTIDI